MTEAATIEPVRPLPTLRDDDGAIRPEFVAEAARALEAGDVETLRQLVDDLHESDLGALVEALEPDQRPRLVELLVAVHDTGSLAAACRQAGLSYRYAWGLLRQGEALFGAPLMRTTVTLRDVSRARR